MRRRREALKYIAGREFDVCVIGGGATGAGCALDAQLRGLRTVLLEGADFASGASGASTKLAHGGVRYLEQAVRKLDAAELRTVRRAVHERVHMLQNAPHLAHPLEFLVPVFNWRQALYYRTGLKMYDWISGEGLLSPSRYLSRKEAFRRMPALAPDGLRGAVIYADGQFDDSRYSLALVQTFAAKGGEAVNYARVTAFAKSPGGRLAEEAAPGAEMIVLREEAKYLLRQLNPYLAKPLGFEQIVSGFAGLRPLIAAGGGPSTKELVRDHEVEVDPTSGLISIFGGKWTTYRLMAEESIDAVQRSLGGPVTPCQTKSHSLDGAGGYRTGAWQELAARYGLSEPAARHLSQKFGTTAEEVLALALDAPELVAPLVAGLPPICAEVVYAIREEMAMTIEDVVARRVGLQFYDWRKSIQAAPDVASLLAHELGWDAVETSRAVADYAAKINGFLAALGLPAEPVPPAAELRTIINPAEGNGAR